MRQQPGPDGASAEALWRFSLALYSRPGVAGALIALQDRAGLDVDLILYVLWLGTCGRRLTAAELTAAAPTGAKIATVLRALRRRLSDGSEREAALGRRVLALEIAAERHVLRRLAAHPLGAAAVVDPDPVAAAFANLSLCLGGEAGSAEAELIRSTVAALARRPPR